MSVPAGWYDDGSGRQRWWDGEQWTEHFAPETPAASDTPAAQESAADETDQGTVLAGSEGTPDAAAPDSHPPVSSDAYPPVTQDGYPQTGYGQAGYPGAQAGYPGSQAGYPGAQAGYPGAEAQSPYGAAAPYGGSDQAYGGYAAAAAGPRKTPVLGYIGLGLAVVGGIIACIPNVVTFGIGSFLLFGAFVVSIIALFIKNTPKWPGIVGLILSIVLGVVASIVLAVTVFASVMQDARDAYPDSFTSDEPWPSESAGPSDEPGLSGERPTAEDLAVGLGEIAATSGSTYPDDLLLCLGEEFYLSDMSDEALQTVADGSSDFADPVDAVDFASTFAQAASNCSP